MLRSRAAEISDLQLSRNLVLPTTTPNPISTAETVPEKPGKVMPQQNNNTAANYIQRTSRGSTAVWRFGNARDKTMRNRLAKLPWQPPKGTQATSHIHD
jgi:hypothetical protein